MQNHAELTLSPRLHVKPLITAIRAIAVSEEAETWLPSFFVQWIIKQLLDSVFVVSVRLITPTSTLIILDVTKTHPIIVY